MEQERKAPPIEESCILPPQESLNHSLLGVHQSTHHNIQGLQNSSLDVNTVKEKIQQLSNNEQVKRSAHFQHGLSLLASVLEDSSDQLLETEIDLHDGSSLIVSILANHIQDQLPTMADQINDPVIREDVALLTSEHLGDRERVQQLICFYLTQLAHFAYFCIAHNLEPNTDCYLNPPSHKGCALILTRFGSIAVVSTNGKHVNTTYNRIKARDEVSPVPLTVEHYQSLEIKNSLQDRLQIRDPLRQGRLLSATRAIATRLDPLSPAETTAALDSQTVISAILRRDELPAHDSL